MLALQYIKSVPRYLATRYIGKFWPAIYTGPYSCIAMREIERPVPPSSDWLLVRTRLCGICGSDLATIQAKGSPYFSPFTSSPFVFGHEIVGEVASASDTGGGFKPGDRIVIEPVLSCVVRGIPELCVPCRNGNYGNCENITAGNLSPGIQTGYCRDTGGGWSEYFLAHKFQCHRVPDELSDEAAVMIEPFSCALHAALKIVKEGPGEILIIGSGTIGLLTISALRALGSPAKITAITRFPSQDTLARKAGADRIIRTSPKLYDEIIAITGAQAFQPEIGKKVLIGGFDCVIDCVGIDSTIDDALRFTRARGMVLLVGMPSVPKNVDWTSIWYKELRVTSSYTYGMEEFQGRKLRTFELAISLVKDGIFDPESMVTGRFALPRYRQAIEEAMNSGKSGAVKTVFDFRLQNHAIEL